MIKIAKKDLDSPKNFKEKVNNFVTFLKEELFQLSNKKILFETNELSDLLLSACRSNDFDILISQQNAIYIDKEKALKWAKEKILPTTIITNLDDPDIIRLLIFSMEITYMMFSGGSKATVTQKGYRERRRTFESILVDQFNGKLGEVFVKKYLEEKFSIKVDLDWEISPNIEKHKKDILNSDENISIKTSPTLAGIWAEADEGYDYGIYVKCSVPSAPILQFFIEVCGFSKLLDFVDLRISPKDAIFKRYIYNMRERIREYKCGEIQSSIKGFICGYFKTSEHNLRKKGEKLPYLGEVRETRHIVNIKDLKWSEKDWKDFITQANIR